jgi:hypothetical protein
MADNQIDRKIVTTADVFASPSRYKLLTNGNAIYDAELDIIFRPGTNEEWLDYKPSAMDVMNLPNRYREIDGGAILDKKFGRLVGHLGGKYQISKETARQMVAMKKAKAVKSQMLGIAAAAGIELAQDATDDEILAGALDGIQALTAHMAKTFMQSNNIRGLGESYARLVAPFVGSQNEVDDTLSAEERKELEKYRAVDATLREISSLAERIEKERAAGKFDTVNNSDDDNIIDAD